MPIININKVGCRVYIFKINILYCSRRRIGQEETTWTSRMTTEAKRMTAEAKMHEISDNLIAKKK